jgi:hypothetical protein
MSEAGARRGRPLARATFLPSEQQLHCAHRAACVSAAAARGFPSFSCAGCCDATPTALSDVAAEHDALLRLAGAILDTRRWHSDRTALRRRQSLRAQRGRR